MTNLSDSLTIHGVRYVLNSNQYKLVRFFWFVILICTICAFGFYLRSAYIKLQISPDISLTTRERDAREFPLPAVTVCSTIFAKNNLTNFIKFNSLKDPKLNFSLSECKYAFANQHWCGAGETYKISYIRCKEYLKELQDIDVINLIKVSGPDQFVSENVKNPFKFTRFITHQGICYTANMIGLSEIFKSEIHQDFKGFFERLVPNFLQSFIINNFFH